MKKGKILVIFALFFTLSVLSTESNNIKNENLQENVPKASVFKTPTDIVDFILKNITDTDKYFFEFMLVVLLVIYVTNYFLGKKLNQKYVLLWIQENKPLFDSEFAHVGVTNQERGALLDSESAHSFKFYATGRLNAVYTLVSFELKKRQDLLSMFIFNFIWPEKDKLRIEVPIEISNPLPFVFAVVKRREAKNVQSNNADIKNFCRKVTHPELEKQFTIFTENDEVSDFLLTKQIVQTLKKYESIIENLSFSDLKQQNKQFLRADLVLTKEYLKNPRELQVFIKMLLYLADNLNYLKLSNTVKTKAEKDRLAYENAKTKEIQKEKQEEIQKKLQEKKKEEAASKKKDEKKEEQRLRKKMQRKFVKMA